MEIIKLNQNNIDELVSKAVETLRAGGLVVYPTETCYGLGADPENQKAINKLLSYKKRREGKPLSVLVDSQEMAEKYVDLNKSAKNFYSRFLPGPMTVVSKSKGMVAGGVESELGTLGIRISSCDLAMKMVREFGRGITATSANASYKKRPYSIDDLLEPLSEKQ
jgi:L-threonylcarbamoyladenylate synthase